MLIQYSLQGLRHRLLSPQIWVGEVILQRIIQLSSLGPKWSSFLVETWTQVTEVDQIWCLRMRMSWAGRLCKNFKLWAIAKPTRKCRSEIWGFLTPVSVPRI